ncbi:MAG TPA: hypothetical protein VHZ54_10050 [Solirubrobacterales bacterium]|jgi:hypothetical protein|nr:hypothetical protein [Solirubrobacterales bacterium]
MATVIPDISPAEVLARFRGLVVEVHPAYPETIHLYVRDALHGLWCLATHDAYYSPSDPEALCGKAIVSADLEGPLGNLTVGFSDGTSFRVWVDPQEAPDDPFNWMLHMPEGLILCWGPGVHWALKRGSDPV